MKYLVILCMFFYTVFENTGVATDTCLIPADLKCNNSAPAKNGDWRYNCTCMKNCVNDINVKCKNTKWSDYKCNEKDITFQISSESTENLWFKNEKYTITCKEGYKPNNNDVACVDGDLQGDYPVCVPIPGTTPNKFSTTNTSPMPSTGGNKIPTFIYIICGASAGVIITITLIIIIFKYMISNNNDKDKTKLKFKGENVENDIYMTSSTLSNASNNVQIENDFYMASGMVPNSRNNVQIENDNYITSEMVPNARNNVQIENDVYMTSEMVPNARNNVQIENNVYMASNTIPNARNEQPVYASVVRPLGYKKTNQGIKNIQRYNASENVEYANNFKK